MSNLGAVGGLSGEVMKEGAGIHNDSHQLRAKMGVNVQQYPFARLVSLLIKQVESQFRS